LAIAIIKISNISDIYFFGNKCNNFSSARILCAKTRRVIMNTTKNKQITALILGIASLVIPNIGSTITNAIDTSTNSGSMTAGIVIIIATLAAIVVGIIGIIKSAGARKEAKEAGEKQILATIGLVLSIVGTVESAIMFFACGLCIACVACAAASTMG
jgi:hypothetical protein